MRQVNIHEAKTHLSELIAAAERGEEVVIARANKPAVRLVPIEAPTKKKRIVGMHQGQMWVAEDFDEPLPDEFWNLDDPNDPLYK